MISVFAIIILVFSYYTSETDGQKGIVPYEFCEMYYWTDNLYVTNYTINDSDFITAEAVMDFIRNSTSFQEKCTNRMLIFTPKRFIKRSPENQEYSVLYNITVKVKKDHLFNKSLLNDNLAELISLCIIQGVTMAIFDKPQFKEYLTLTLNESGRLLKIMIQPFGEQGPSEPTCNIEEPVCPTRSKVINNTCVCKPGTYLSKNVTECRPCSKNTYQSQPAKISCLPCPPRSTTLGKSGSISRSNCSVCQPGSYLDLNTTTCHPCLLHSYQDKTGQINCIRCPDGKITANISSSSLVDCIKNCTQGLYYNYTSEICVQCPLGKYQPSTGQDKCKKCPPGTITHEIGSVYLTSCTNCTSGSYYDKRNENCISCPKNTFQDLFGAMECEPCPAGKVTSSPGAMTRADCVTEKDSSKYVLKIALSIAAIVILVVLIIAIKLFVDRRRIKTLMKKFKKNIEVFDNAYANRNDEERDVEHCTTLGHLEEKVLAGRLEIPRDCLQFTGVILGRGNFGEVYEVLVKRPDEPEILCAAKTSRGAKEGCHLRVEDMLEELDTHMKLEKNPNIVNLLGVCSSNDGPFYLLMEHCGIGCLSTFLKSRKETSDYINTAKIEQLSIEWKLQCSLEICNGMKYLAEKRIVHRDLAARNILLDDDMVAKVSDFGMAKDVYVKCYYKQTNEGNFPLRWMAIESIEELKFTEKTDVWSFGVLLWEIFTDSKRPYYSTINDEKVAQYILSGKKLKKPSQCPKSFYRIMLKCWSDKDCHRPQFQDLYEELDLYIKNEQHQKPEAVTTTMSSFRKRFNETKRGVSRKLSLRRQSTKNRRKSIDSEMSFPNETPQSIKKRRRRESQDTGNSFELVDVLECDIDNVPSRQDSDGNPAVVANGGQTGGILTDDTNGKNIDPMYIIPEQRLRLEEADFCEPNEAGSSMGLNEVISGDELNEANANVNSNQDSNNVDLTHFDHASVKPSNTQLTETADTDQDGSMS